MGRLLEAAREAELLRGIIARSGEVAYRYRALEPRGFEYISDSIAALIGYTPAEYYAEPDLANALVHPDDVPVAIHCIRFAPTQGTDTVLRWVRRDGNIVWTRQRLNVLRDAEGNPEHVEGLVRQVSIREAEGLRLPMLQRVRRGDSSEPALRARV